MFNDPPAEIEIYCDVTTPARWETGLVTMVDLDLDVARFRVDGAVKLLDEDEFAEHRIRYVYPADVVVQASAAADWLYQQVTAGREPFGSTYRQWLDRVREGDASPAAPDAG